MIITCPRHGAKVEIDEPAAAEWIDEIGLLNDELKKASERQRIIEGRRIGKLVPLTWRTLPSRDHWYNQTCICEDKGDP